MRRLMPPALSVCRGDDGAGHKKTYLCTSRKDMMKSLALHLLALAVLLPGCAKIVTPAGGPKDTDPPEVMREQPANGSTGFNGRHIRITFDEFVTTNAPAENVVFSPPLRETPAFTLKGKSLLVKFNDSLRSNTTYNMVFSNFIRDYHEGNPLAYYHYSFSTGAEIDSFRMDGKITDALTMEPQADFFVMLYFNDIDSLPLTTRPDYVTKSRSDGTFAFRNIRCGNYKVFALKDLNGNLLYDLPGEAIAFYDTPVCAVRADTLPKDTLPKGGRASHAGPAAVVRLRAFTENSRSLKLLETMNPEPGVYRFRFNAPVGRFSAVPSGKGIGFFQVIAPTADTVTWYLKEPLADTLAYILHADSLCDTVGLVPFRPRPKTGRGRDRETAPRLHAVFLNEGHLYKPLTLKFGFPVKPLKAFPVIVRTQQKNRSDTMLYTASVPDTFVTELPLPLTFEGKKSYTVTIPGAVFEGYNGLTHDTLRTSFITKSEKDYGSLTIHCLLPSDGVQHIVQLWKEKSLIQETLLTESRTIDYRNLDPGSYRIKAIGDLNGNGRWDTGDYRARRQPEPAEAFAKTITLRAFWDVEETFEIRE